MRIIRVAQILEGNTLEGNTLEGNTLEGVGGTGGWVGPVYHGSSKEFDNFEIGDANVDHTPLGDEGVIYLTPDKSYASQYGDVKTCSVNLGKYDVVFIKEGLDRLRSGELDTLLVAPNWRPFKNENLSLSDVEEIVVLDPQRVRVEK